MMRMKGALGSRLTLIAVACCAALGLFLAPGVPGAKADKISPMKCDSIPKYHCSYIDYGVDYGSNWYVTHARVWQGARDGGAQRWQLLFADDWRWTGLNWEQSRHYDETAWLTNIDLGGSPWWAYNGDDGVPNGAMVGMQHRFYECAASCYYWSDPVDWHALQ
jgi:hypothetical protein